jgi:hypothetical protein
MDIFKKFLDDTCTDTKYKYDRVEKLAEVYLPGDVVPIATVEYDRSIAHYKIRFRLALSAINIATLTSKMTLADCALLFEDDFFIHETYGYLYGDDARQAFIDRLKTNIETAQFNENASGAFFVSEEPLFSHGEEPRTKWQKMWDEE